MAHATAAAPGRPGSATAAMWRSSDPAGRRPASRLKARRRRRAAPVDLTLPHALVARAAGRGAVPRLDGEPAITANDMTTPRRLRRRPRSVRPGAARAPDPHDWIYLASQSPRRRQLLAQIGCANCCCRAGRGRRGARGGSRRRTADADYCEARHAPSCGGARALATGSARRAILCSDTTVALGRQILGKPRDAHAMATLHGARAARTASSRRWRSHRAGASGWLNVSRVRFDAIPAAAIRALRGQRWPFGRPAPTPSERHRGLDRTASTAATRHHGFASLRDGATASPRRRN